MTSAPRIRTISRALTLAAAATLATFSARGDVDGGASANPPHTATATIADASAPAAKPPIGATAEALKKPLDEAAAVAKISALPEVTAVEAELKKGHVPMAIRRDDDGSAGRFELAIAEEHDDHQVTRYRFAIDPASGAISAYEVECDLWSPLETWRALRKKLSAMTPAQRSSFDTCAELSR